MKKIKNVIILLIVIIVGNIQNVCASDYSSINLNKLEEIKDNQELLDTVLVVEISYESDLSLIDILKKCSNLSTLRIKKAEIDNLAWVNDINPNEDFILELRMGYYNLDGLSNSNVRCLVIESCYMTNFSKGMDFPNLQELDIQTISGYEDIDYSNFTKLETLSLQCIEIKSYKNFFEQLKTLEKLEYLGLVNCNINDNDTIYLKTLKNIKSLSLEMCHIEDISFLEEMSQLTYLRPPINVEDMSVIKRLPNLKTIYWTGYEQLALTDELVKYLDDNKINHFKYESKLKETLLNMVSEMDITEDMTIKEKVEVVIDYVTDFIISHDDFYDEEYTGNSLLYITHYRTGLCSQYSYLEHALLRLIGVDSYYIAGLIPVYMREQTGDFYSPELKYELAGHAWLMAKDEEGVWYGWDPVQIDQYIITSDGIYVDSVYGKKINFWKNPYEDDSYTYEEYLNGEYDTYNYNFAKRRVVTNKIGYDDYLKQKNEKKEVFNSLKNGMKLKDKYLYNIKYNTMISNNNFDINSIYKYTLYDKDNKMKNTGNLATGDYIKIFNKSNSLVDKYTLSVIADANGDGSVTPLDYIRIKNHIMGDFTITGFEYLDAADANRDGSITPLDYIRIKNLIMNGEV